MSCRNQIKLALTIFVAVILLINLGGCRESGSTSTLGDFIGVGYNYFPDEKSKGDHFLVRIAGHIVHSEDNEPFSGLVINAYENDFFKATTTSTGDGSFYFDLPKGFYNLRVAINTESYLPISYHIHVFEDGTVAPEEILIKTYSKPSKSLYDINGTLLEKGNPPVYIKNTLVELFRGGNTIKLVQSDEAGSFEFSTLEAGNYVLRFANEDLIYREKQIVLTIGNDGLFSPPVDIVFLERKKVDPNYQISGIVQENLTNTALSNIKIDLWKDRIGANPLKTTFTTGDGKFYFNQMEEGLYFLRVGDGQTTYTVREDYVVEILENGEISPDNITISLSENLSVALSKTLTGYVKDSFTGLAVGYATVELENHGIIVSDMRGKFAFNSVNPGKYKLDITKSGFAPMQDQISIYVEDNKIFTEPADLTYFLAHELNISSYGAIAGRLFNNQGDPLGGRTIRVYEMKRITQIREENDKTISETSWEINQSHVTSTKTNSGSTGVSNAGTFVISELKATSADIKYMIYAGESDSVANFTNVLSDRGFFWSAVIDTINLIHLWKEVEVAPNTTTYLSNYTASRE